MSHALHRIENNRVFKEHIKSLSTSHAGVTLCLLDKLIHIRIERINMEHLVYVVLKVVCSCLEVLNLIYKVFFSLLLVLNMVV